MKWTLQSKCHWGAIWHVNVPYHKAEANFFSLFQSLKSNSTKRNINVDYLLPSIGLPILSAWSCQTEETLSRLSYYTSVHCTFWLRRTHFNECFEKKNKKQINKSRKPWFSHVTLNLTVYWLSVDNLTYPTNHATRRITRFTLLAGPFAFRELT